MTSNVIARSPVKVFELPPETAAVSGRLFELIEASRGNAASPPGLGDLAAAGLAAVGITKKRVSRLLGGGCGCSKRQAAWNEFGSKWLGLPPGFSAPVPTETTQSE
jgi:hypothetical protein